MGSNLHDTRPHNRCPFAVVTYAHSGGYIPCTDGCALYDLDTNECIVYLDMKEHKATQGVLREAAEAVKRAADKYTEGNA